MALQLYSDGFFFLDGAMLSETVNFNVEHVSNAHEIITQSKGFSGISPGAKMTKGSISNVIPRAGYEVDFIDKLQNDTVVELVFYGASHKTKFKGFIINAKEEYGADKPSSFSCDFVGSPAERSTL